MLNKINKVVLVLDQDFGEQLESLAPLSHVWVIDSQANRIVAEKYWQEYPGYDLETGITVFQAYEGDELEQACLRVLDTVDEHHGEYSSDPPYSVLEVIGIPISEQIKEALKKIGFGALEETVEGFRFTRIRGKNDSKI